MNTAKLQSHSCHSASWRFFFLGKERASKEKSWATNHLEISDAKPVRELWWRIQWLRDQFWCSIRTLGLKFHITSLLSDFDKDFTAIFCYNFLWRKSVTEKSFLMHEYPPLPCSICYLYLSGTGRLSLLWLLNCSPTCQLSHIADRGGIKLQQPSRQTDQVEEM